MMMGILFIFFILIVVGIVMAIIWASKRSNWTLKRTNFIPFEEISENNSLEILKVRYAKGEITKKEFETMEKDIN